ncbi:hypothetical protein ACCO45_005433 [Purpureocillium lilacinum]|uniref:Uncharacterized protein n=1 Tax=Purpureocillium lilacinum TaxID=33203 RepID=A0ACC4DVE5_PURLI
MCQTTPLSQDPGQAIKHSQSNIWAQLLGLVDRPVFALGELAIRNLLDWLPDIQTTSLVHRGVSEGRRCRPSLARPRNRAGIAASEQRFTGAPRKELDRPLTLRGAALVHLSRPPGPSSRVAAVTLQSDLRDRPTRVLGSMASKLHKAVSHVSTAALSPRAGV